MRKILLAVWLLAGCWVLPAQARDVKVVTQDNRFLHGELIGINNGKVYLQGKDNHADVLPVETVSGIFDAVTGEAIPFTKTAASASPTPVATMTPTTGITPVKTTWMFINGNLQSGMVAYLPCRPLEEPYVPGSAYGIGMQPYDSAWGAGLALDWRMMKNLAATFDLNMSRWEKLLAKKDGYGVGDWVWEQNDYNDARVGPFPMDVKYYMDTTSLRLGMKYYPVTGAFQPWAGLSLGMYAWQATIGNREEEKKYSDHSTGVSYSSSLQLGMDFVFGEFVLRFFGDFATAVGQPRFENLFQPGWTYESTELVEGVYRFGLAVGMAI